MVFVFNHVLLCKQKISQGNTQMAEACVMSEETVVSQRPFVIAMMWLILRQRFGG